jgi:hypothetical protein
MLTEGARKIYHGRHGARGRRVGQGCCRWSFEICRSLITIQGRGSKRCKSFLRFFFILKDLNLK